MDRFDQAERRRLLRLKAIDYLGGVCTICQYSGCPEALDFHHTNPLEKDFNLSSKLTSWACIEAELAKCVLLCARCHREVHAGHHPTYLDHADMNRSHY